MNLDTYLSTVTAATRRILEAERASRRTLSHAERVRALDWYRLHRDALVRIVDTEGVRAETAIAAAATLSPATSWALVMAGLPGFLRAAQAGDPRPPFATYGRQRTAAARIVRLGLGVLSVTGPKVNAFARALTGDGRAVVIDRHAARIALGDDGVVGVNRGTLEALQDAYTLAARRLALEPAGLQALVWVARAGFDGVHGGAR